MRSIDLTHLIDEEGSVYPGAEPPRLEAAFTLERDGFRETLLTLPSHTGTHMDAPAHLLPGGATLDQLPVDQFVGPALVVDCTNLRPGEPIGMDRLALYAPALGRAQFVLFYTGWDRFWGTKAYYGAFPVPAPEVLTHLAGRNLKGVGIDAPSIDPMGATPLSRHRIALEAGMVILENLTRLDEVRQSVCTLLALPLKVRKADGAPARVMAFEDDVEHSLFYDLTV